VVLAGADGHWRVLVPAEDLDACKGSPAELLEVVEARLGR